MAAKVRFQLSIFMQFVCLAPCALVPHTNSRIEPLCNPPCPPNAYCIEHKRQCECYTGYYQNVSEQNGLPLCRPLCLEQHCLPPLICVGPNECGCPNGYLYEHLECMPQCSLRCQNGYCQAPEVCACYEGFRLQGNNLCVEEPHTLTVQSTTTFWETSKIEEGAKKSEIYPTDTDLSVTVASSEAFNNPILELWQQHFAETTTSGKSYASEGFWDDAEEEEEEDPHNISSTVLPADYVESNELVTDSDTLCSAGFVYYAGACRPQIVEVTTTTAPQHDCNLAICGPHTFCGNNGECLCASGYLWQYDISGRGLSCVSANARNDRSDLVNPPPADPKSSCLRDLCTFVGITCITAALFSLLAYLYRNRK